MSHGTLYTGFGLALLGTGCCYRHSSLQVVAVAAAAAVVVAAAAEAAAEPQTEAVAEASECWHP